MIYQAPTLRLTLTVCPGFSIRISAGSWRGPLGCFVCLFQFSPFSETARTLSSNKCLGIEEAGDFVGGLDLTFSLGTFCFWGGLLIVQAKDQQLE